MTAMASTLQHPMLAVARHGFVVAMRARVTTAKRQPWYEWIIVSRWGPEGEHLSVGRSKVPALPGKPAPIHLTPCQTALAGLPRTPPVSGPRTFVFAQQKPESLSVAGDFTPVEGYVRLHGIGAVQRLLAEGRCIAGAMRSAWRVEAVRAAWIGEFIESTSAVAKQ
jgi:hypothetical protein